MTKKQNVDFYNNLWDMISDFHKYYPAYLHRQRFILKQIRNISQKASIADMGCGPGILINSIYEEFNDGERKFYGFDVASSTIEKNQKILPHIQFIHYDCMEAPGDLRFDVIICSEVIEHVPNYKVAIENIARSLNPGGTCIITVPKGEIFYTEQMIGHVRHFFVDEIVDEFAKYGIKTILAKSSGFPFHDLSKILSNIYPRAAMKKFVLGKTSFSSRLIFKIFNWLYYLNFLPLGKQVLFVGRKDEINQKQ